MDVDDTSIRHELEPERKKAKIALISPISYYEEKSTSGHNRNHEADLRKQQQEVTTILSPSYVQIHVFF